MKKTFFNIYKIITLFSIIISSLNAQYQNEIIGKWDLHVESVNSILPSWLEVKLSGTKTLVGNFVEYNGSSRPISEVYFYNDIVDFTIPSQWNGDNDLHFSAKLKNDGLNGHILSSKGESLKFRGERAPKLIRKNKVEFGKPTPLFNGKDLEGWKPQSKDSKNQWYVEDDILINPYTGVNLVSESTFEDFKLHLEVRYPKKSNSGIYLRGRYEVQVEDSYGKDPSSILFGAVYGFLTPNEMAAKKAGEWQVFDITLIGRRVTILVNEKAIINDQIIPGITGGAMDSNEGFPGPIMFQGDHGKVEYRNIMISIPK